MASSPNNRRASVPILAGLLRAGDLVMIAAAAVAAHHIRFGSLAIEDRLVPAVAIVLLLAANTFHVFRLYDLARLQRNDLQIGRLVPASALVLLAALSVGFLTKTTGEYSRLWVTYWSILGFAGLVSARLSLKALLVRWQKQGKMTRRIAVYGAGKQGQRIVGYLAAKRDPGIEVVGIFDDRQTRVPKTVSGAKVRGDLNDLMKSVRAKEVDEVMVALPWDAEDRLLTILRRLKVVPVDVRLCPEGVAFQFPNRPFSDLQGLSVLNIYEKPLSSWNLVIKMAEDRLLAFLILIFVLPSMLVIALLIKLDSAGPILFRQKRHGFNNEVIEVYKFRTMYHDRAEEPEIPQATQNDPRVTKIGRVLRRTSLDELPQFLNVLKGEMSIVGPRPHAVAHNEKFAAIFNEYLARHNVKPGITGWAQINGLRGEIHRESDMKKRMEYDVYYIENWSLLFDLKILLLTPIFGFLHNKAY